jgi:hypothetical protein
MMETPQTGALAGVSDEDWLNQGKADAWAGNPKCAPDSNSEAASLYDLGYCEGKITHPFHSLPTIRQN